MNRTAWRIALTVVSVAALGVTGWSLYAVAHHYDAPKPIGIAAFAVFDGTAYACLHLASEASAAGRSAIGARLASLGMAGVSVYLNNFHANLVHGGTPAAVLFSAPTLALLAVSELSWAGPRAAKKAEQRGEQPFRMPALGGWSWTIAPIRAGRSVKARAIQYIDQSGQVVRTDPDKPVTATERLRKHFATLDPLDAIRLGHESQPDLPPAELAALLRTYGVNIDAVQVALALRGRPTEINVNRADLPPDPRIELTRADMLSGPRPDNITAAVRELVRRGITDREPVISITRDVFGPDTNPDTIRRTLTREIERTQKDTHDQVGKGGDGYV